MMQVSQMPCPLHSTRRQLAPERRRLCTLVLHAWRAVRAQGVANGTEAAGILADAAR